jgi:G:T-mismatch repair DNA endonuclease (very short patch repair protein)
MKRRNKLVVGFTFNKGFSDKEFEKILKNLYLLREVDGKPIKTDKMGRTRPILAFCSECGKTRKIRLCDYIKCQSNLCKSCRMVGKRNPAKKDYVRKKLSRKGVKDTSYITPEWRKKFSKKRMGKGNPMYGRKRTKKAKQLTSEAHKKKFLDDDYCREFGKRFVNKPTKPELILNDILSPSYKYVGDLSFWIGGKNPDFVDKKNKKVIEMFGEYWHSEKRTGIPRDKHERELIQHYRKYNFNCLIIWEFDLKDIKTVKKRIRRFNDE